MLLRIRIDYDSSQKVKALPEAEYMKLRDIFTSLPESQKLDDYRYYGHEVIAKAEDLDFLDRFSLQFEIKSYKGIGAHSSLIPIPTTAPLASSTHIHVPNLGLLSIKEVIVLDDGCTDTLQDKLDDGWMILAICPPNGQRRPDYILGRTRE